MVKAAQLDPVEIEGVGGDQNSYERLDHENNELLEIQENASESWKLKDNKYILGVGRRRFRLVYYPDRGTQKGLTTSHAGERSGGGWRRRRRRHPYLKPQKLSKAHSDDLYFLGNSIKIDRNYKCLDAGHDNDLNWYNCHNGQNQVFWKERWGSDQKKNAWHLRIGGNRGNRRRRGACVDYGGGRLYIHGCHDGDNQRWIFQDPTTTTTTILFPVRMVTNSFPEKISWQIMDITKGKPKAVPGCSGSTYETWYANMKTDCKLRNGKRYKVTCRDNKYSEGWAGGYLKISNLKVCGNWAWNAKSKSKTVKLVAKKSVKVMKR